MLKHWTGISERLTEPGGNERGLRKIFAGFFVDLGSETFEARAAATAGLVLRMIRPHGRGVRIRGTAAAGAAGAGYEPFAATSILSANVNSLIVAENLPDWLPAAAAATGLAALFFSSSGIVLKLRR